MKCGKSASGALLELKKDIGTRPRIICGASNDDYRVIGKLLTVVPMINEAKSKIMQVGTWEIALVCYWRLLIVIEN